MQHQHILAVAITAEAGVPQPVLSMWVIADDLYGNRGAGSVLISASHAPGAVLSLAS